MKKRLLVTLGCSVACERKTHTQTSYNLKVNKYQSMPIVQLKQIKIFAQYYDIFFMGY